jgi:inorganic phosphate transporter, PiT family
MPMELLLFAAAMALAVSNGANDNFKGFATVWGSDTLSYRQALALATVATVAGSLASWVIASELVQQFSGKGLVPDSVARAPLFILSVSAGAASAVVLATRLGFPVSTTHALIGGLVGAGLAQDGGQVHLAQLTSAFLLPLLASPVLAAALGLAAHRLMKRRPVRNDCACVVAPQVLPRIAASAAAPGHMALPQVLIAADAVCDRVPVQARTSIRGSLDKLHVLSAMSICFARGVNDTPKLAALLIAAHVVNAGASVALMAAAMGLGGLMFARKVAETMSRRVSRMDHSQGLAANLITASLVLAASKLGLPVSTTHVAVGSIGGVGASAGALDRKALRNILLSWIATLPVAACAAWLVSRLG